MLTDKLYYKDSYLSDFEATVTKVGDGFVVLDRTAFFPEGGGQTSDDGFIDSFKVVKVKEVDDEIRHYMEDKNVSLEEGKTYSCRVNFDERIRKMKKHSAEHIFSGLVHSTFGYDNVGFHLSDIVTLDFSGELTWQQVMDTERKANEVIQKNIEIKTYFPKDDEIDSIPFRSKLELSEMKNLRIVEIEGVDICACCAPHVSHTGEIGLLKILSAERHRGGMRLTMTAGMDALDVLGGYQKSVTEISNILSAPREDVSSWVATVKEERDKARFDKTALELELIKHLPTDDNCVKVNLSDEAQREYCNILMNNHKIAAVICGEKYIIGSKSINLRELAKEINTAIDGRGGGRPEMIMGTAKADFDRIYSYFKEFI